MGTNMFPGRASSSTASPTISEPMPTRRPSRVISAAPPKPGCGGEVKIASGSRYSQYPAKSRRETTLAGTICGGLP